MIKQAFAAIASLLLCIVAAAQTQETMTNALTTRQQHLVAVASLEAKGDIAGLYGAIDDALDDLLTVSELKEAFSQLYAYTGFPRSLNALGALQAVVERRAADGRATTEGDDAAPLPADYDALAAGTAVQAQLTGNDRYYYAFAPATDYYLKAHLFGDIFARNTLSFADRELVTIGALSGLEGVEPQRRAHVVGSMNMGVTADMLRCVPLVLAEKVGATEAYRAAATVSEVLGESFSALPPLSFGRGASNDAYAEYFTGSSFLEVKSQPGDPIGISNVTFEPGCRNNWHIHHATTGGGQVLICVEGEGWYQEWGKAAQSLKAGDVVEIPAGVKHWHGAKSDSWFSHYAFHVPGTDITTEWLEPVSDDDYAALGQ